MGSPATRKPPGARGPPPKLPPSAKAGAGAGVGARGGGPSTRPAAPAATAGARSKPTLAREPPPVAGVFSNLDDVMAHVEALRQNRLGQLGAAAMAVQAALRRLMERQRARAGALGDMAVTGTQQLTSAVNLAEVDLYAQRVAHACANASLRESLLPFFLDPVNAGMSPDEPFTHPSHVHANADAVRDARVQLLHASQAVIRDAYFAFCNAEVMRGEALAQAAYILIVEDTARATSEASLARCTERLDSLRKVLPHSPLAVEPFLAKVAEYLPPVGDMDAAEALAVGVPPSAPLDTVDAVVAYGAEVRANRRSVLDDCQRRIRDAFMRFTARLVLRARGLAELVSSRVAAMWVAASDTELTQLLDVVSSAVELLPHSEPAPSTFLAEVAPLLPADTAVPVPSFGAPYEVFEYAESVQEHRLQQLHAAADTVAAAYRRYRNKMASIGDALGQLAVAVLYAFADSRSDLELQRATWRLDGCTARVPIADAASYDAFLESVNGAYEQVQDLDGYSCPLPPFASTDDVVQHGAALAEQRLAVLGAAQLVLRRAFTGYKARVGLASVAMAELVMSTIRGFETALDRELGLLSTRVEQALQRVRGHKDAERMFLEALNRYMSAAEE